jgi:DNA-binding transcriptional ArsR family regulator
MKYEKSLEMFFVSKVRIKALRYFMMNPTTPIHLRGAVREFKEEINAVRRELFRLEETSLIRMDAQANRKYFKLNTDHPFLSELMSMFHKTYDFGGEIISNAKKLGSIEFAILTESYTKGIFIGDQVLDFAIVGTVDMALLNEIIKKYEDKSGREIHYTVLKPSEYQIRKRRKDDFIMNILVQDIVMLVGDRDEFVR